MRYFLRGKKALLGFRGRVILHFVVMWLAIAISLITDPLRPATQALEKHHSTAFIYALLPTWVQVSFWVLSALVALFFCRTDPAKPHDRIAFQALVIPPAMVLFSYLVAFVYNIAVYHIVIPEYFTGIPVWAFFLSLVLTFSRWPEPVVGEVAHEPH